METYETMLGFYNGKVVVACKDFLRDVEISFDYNAIKNEYDEEIESALENLSSTSSLHLRTLLKK